MFNAQPPDRLSVMAPSIVVCRMPSNDVHVELLRVVHPPEEDQVMPAARNWLAAEAWVTAEAGSAPARSVTSASSTAAASVRGRGRESVSEMVMVRNLGPGVGAG